MRVVGLPLLFISAAAALTFTIWGAAQTLGSPPTRPIPLDEQIRRGKQVYRQNCQRCHGDKLQGLRGPTLRGKDFLTRWATIGNLHAKISTTMPRSAPASLAPQDYLDVVAFIMDKNGVPFDKTSLTASSFKQKLTGK